MSDTEYKKELRRSLNQFGHRLQQISGERAPSGSGIAFMIGSLGCGGAERQLVNTIKGLKERGVGPLHIHSVFLKDPAQRFFLPDAREAGAAVSELRDTPPGAALAEEHRWALEVLPPDLSEAGDYALSLSLHRPRVVHLWMDEVNIKGGLAAVALGVKRIVLSIRNESPEHFGYNQPYLKSVYHWLLARPNVMLISNSLGGARSYADWLGIPVERANIIHNAFVGDDELIRRSRAERPAMRRELDLADDAPVVGGVFRFYQEKRPYLWLESFKLVLNGLPQARCLLVGDGPMRQEVHAKIAELGLKEQVRIIPNTSNVFRPMAAMDLLLLTSKVEGLPNVILEAQAAGLPVVTTAVGGAPEALDPGRTGVVVQEADPEHIAGAVLSVLGSPVMRREAAEYGPAFVRGHFGLEEMLDKTQALYGAPYQPKFSLFKTLRKWLWR